MTNQTMRKFGYPDTLVGQFGQWVVLLRPAQPTLGSLVLAARSEATAYSQLSAEAFADQAEAVRAIEAALAKFCGYERINYLMLMMVDPNVHFHVIPRYRSTRTWAGIEFRDSGWPGPPQVKDAVELEATQLATMRDEIKALI